MGRTRSARAPAAVIVALALAAGCASSGVAAFRAVPEMNGVRTADGGRQLVVTYVGGGCDERAKTRVVETADLVTVTAAIPTAGGNCASIGIARELTFHLPTPLADRHFRNGLRGRPVTVFDGSILRTPTWLPPGYHEMVNFQRPSANGSWARSWLGPATYSDPDLSLTIGPHGLPAAEGTLVPGQFHVGTAVATVRQDASVSEVSIQWTDPASHVARELTSEALDSKTTLSLPVLLRVADSVRT